MKRKNYLVENLSKEEKLYLKRIVMTARNKYIEKNYNYINSTDVSIDTVVSTAGKTVLDIILENCQEDVASAIEFEETLSNPTLQNIVKALSLKEKEVLFHLYKKEENISETAKAMHLSRKTVSKYRDKAQSKIIKKLINGGM